MTVPPFDRIGKFQITDLVGEGAMGVVYRARDPVLNRYVAIKLMGQAMAGDDSLRGRFLREAQAAGSLQHPNIVTIYDSGEYDGHLYIAMEYIEGADLAEIIERKDPLSLATRLDIVIDVLQGLDYAHQRGVIHRDIKPANIRVSTAGHAKIMDFGVARLAESNMTQSGMLMGTPNYMAPEQVTGDRVTPATDVFAVGTLLYELATGSRPFPAATLHAVLYKVTTEDPRPITEIVPGLPQSLQAVVARALAKQPADRYATAHEMLEAVSAVRAEVTGAGETPTVIRHTPLRTLVPHEVAAARRRRRTAAAGIAVALVAAAGVLWWAPWRGAPAVEPPGGANPAAAVVAAPATPPTDSAAPADPVPVRAAPAPATAPPAARAPAPAPTAAPETVVIRAAPVAPARDTVSPAATDSPPVRDTTPRVPVTVPPPRPEPTPPPAAEPPPDPRPALRAVLDRYAAAIAARDLDQLRRVYPGMTATQREGWEGFFRAVRNLSVTLRFETLEVAGDSATGAVQGVYAYENASTGRSERQPISFTALFARSGDGWRLVTVR